MLNTISAENNCLLLVIYITAASFLTTPAKYFPCTQSERLRETFCSCRKTARRVHGLFRPQLDWQSSGMDSASETRLFAQPIRLLSCCFTPVPVSWGNSTRRKAQFRPRSQPQ